ncbi:MAG: S8 family serine peptidase, partial [Lachnospiraceae bacterium]|nr:S8 family serine peptidase [Lachnospiraceae bacterium]
DYLLEGSDSDQAWQDGVDAVAQDAWDVKAVGAEDADVKVDKKVKIAVLDSGLDKFAELTVDGCMNFVNPETEDMGVDTTGHGTAVQNIIMSGENSVATESVAGKKCGISMYSVKVLDEKNQAPVSRIAAAIQWCMDNEMDIIHMSFGTLVPSRVLGQAVKDAADRGILMIAAAGNGGEAGESTVEYPAAFPEVIGVGSVNQEMEVSEFSSRGEEIELVAPGENVPVSVPWGFYGVNSGTSFAAPHVTAIAGMLWAEDATKSAEDIRSLLRSSANGRWEEREGGSGLVDYDYARELAPGYERDEEEKISDTNEKELETYDVPEVVQARWFGNPIKENPTISYRHRHLISDANDLGGFAKPFTGDELNILYVTVAMADDTVNINDEYSKALATCRVMHAGRYYDKSTGNNYVNYVAAGRCLYNCAYMMWTSNYNKDQLKAYTDKWYNSNVQSATAKN